MLNIKIGAIQIYHPKVQRNSLIIMYKRQSKMLHCVQHDNKYRWLCDSYPRSKLRGILLRNKKPGTSGKGICGTSAGEQVEKHPARP